MRIAFEARGKYRKQFVDCSAEYIKNIDGLLHFGDRQSDFDVTGLVRNKILKGRKGFLLTRDEFLYKDNNWKTDHYLDEHFEVFKDQLRRNSGDFVKRGHKLDLVRDYYNFYRALSNKIELLYSKQKITHVVFFEIPHLAIDYVLYIVAQKRGIPTLILSQKIPGKIFSMWNINDFGNLQINTELKLAEEVKKNDVNLFYMDASWQEKSPRGQFNLNELIRLLRNIAYNRTKLLLSPVDLIDIIKRTRTVKRSLPYWRDFIKFDFSEAQLQYFEKLCDFECNQPDLNTNFIYVPLHLQPEMTTSSLGGEFVDQALLIETLSKLLPKGWKIYVKENPKQSCYDRPPRFFERINNLTNVLFVPADTDTNELSAKARIVATVSGVAGWEAIKLGTPALIFGVTWYASMPGVFKYYENIDLIKIASYRINKQILERSINQLFSKTHEGNIDKVYFKHVEDFNKETNAKTVGKLIGDLLSGNQRTTFCKSA